MQRGRRPEREASKAGEGDQTVPSARSGGFLPGTGLGGERKLWLGFHVLVAELFYQLAYFHVADSLQVHQSNQPIARLGDVTASFPERDVLLRRSDQSSQGSLGQPQLLPEKAK